MQQTAQSFGYNNMLPRQTKAYTPGTAVPKGWASYLSTTPGTPSWVTKATLDYPRYGHKLVPLADGRLFCTPGWCQAADYVGATSSFAIYDPVANTWTPKGGGGAVAQHPSVNAQASLQSPGACRLQSGLILFHGGTGAGTGNPFTYNPGTNTWTDLGNIWSSLSTNYYGHSLTTLADGKVLVSGGFANGSATTSCYVHDPSGPSFTAKQGLPVARGYHADCLLADGRVFVAGGYNSTSGVAPSSYLQDAHIYNPGTNAWTTVAPPPFPMSYATAVLLPSGNVLVSANTHDGSAYKSRYLIYSPGTNTWREVATTGGPSRPSIPGSIGIVAGTVFEVGGSAPGAATSGITQAAANFESPAPFIIRMR